MAVNPLHAAAPLFLGLIAAEAIVAWCRGRRIHDLRDVTTDMGCAVLSQFVNVFVSVLSVWAYNRLGASWRDAGWPAVPWWPTNSLVVWVGAILLVDFMQYVIHILNHRVSILWACHLVHHSSEELNLAVAIRTGVFSGLFNLVFMLPFSLLGLPWEMLGAAYAMNVAWQFWLHTQLVPRLGPLEAVLNTPSHHRVHHGSDAEYMDRNFAGILIVWDRLFGTFTEERHAPTYGVTPPLASADPVWVNLYGLTQVVHAVRAASTWRGRLWAVFGPPRWHDLPAPPPPPPRPALTPSLVAYATAQSLLVLVGTVHLLPALGRLHLAEVALLTIGAGFTLSNVGRLLEGRRGARKREHARIAITACIGGLAPLDSNGVVLWITGYAIVSLACLATTHARASRRPAHSRPQTSGERYADAVTTAG
jgi:sterol desaturase/sphingolipid hydroxylase (fatty acid hydroxylase superfamily)